MLFLPLAFFLLYMFGVERIESIGDLVSFESLLGAFANLFLKLFSPQGLAAIFSLVVLEFCIAVRIASTARRRNLALADRLRRDMAMALARESLAAMLDQIAEQRNWLEEVERDYRKLCE